MPEFHCRYKPEGELCGRINEEKNVENLNH
jgi:hypothetical protein